MAPANGTSKWYQQVAPASGTINWHPSINQSINRILGSCAGLVYGPPHYEARIRASYTSIPNTSLVYEPRTICVRASYKFRPHTSLVYEVVLVYEPYTRLVRHAV